MKTVIFTGGNQPDIKTLMHYIQDYDLTIAADSGLHTADKLGIYPDYIIGDMDSLTDQGLLKKYNNADIRKFPCEKDFTDTDAAIRIAEENNTDVIIFSGGGGGRVEHLLYFFKTFSLTKASLIWIHDTGLAFCIDAKTEKRLILPNVKGSYVSICSVGEAPHKIYSKGLFWKLDNVDWQNGEMSLSNKQIVQPDSSVQKIDLELKAGRFIVFLSPLNIYDFQIEKHKY